MAAISLRALPLVTLFFLTTQALAESSAPIEEVIAKLQEIREHTLQVVDGLSDEDLDKPSHAPEEMKDYFGTIGQCLAAIPIHFAFHGGQVADARRAAGRQPLMA